MNIKLHIDSNKKDNNIKFYCNIDYLKTSKITDNLHDFSYENELIYKYFIQVTDNRLTMDIYLSSNLSKKFYLNLVGSKIFDFVNKLNLIEVNIKSNIKGNIEDVIYGFYRKDYIFNKYLNKNKYSKYFHNHKLNRKNTILLNSLNYLKQLVSEPSNIIFPDSFAKLTSTNINKKNLTIKILSKDKIKKLGLNCLLAVNQGSYKEPKVVEYVSSPNKKNVDILFVGKGVCFDSGGISIKPSAGMEDMKWDMAGAAVVASIMKYLSATKRSFSYAGIIGLVENMPGGKAYKPGDIIKSYKGINVEVLNTDAEGRLVLADIISYGCDVYKPKIVIDFATLTGAIMIALGQQYAGLYSNDDNLAKTLFKSGIETDDKLWRMPLHQSFDEQLNSPFVDLKNISSGRYGGSITAAQFLQRFIPEHTKWAHLDIAGVTWKDSGDILNSRGATGFGLTLISDFIDRYF